MVSPCSFPYSKKQLFWFFYLMTLAFVGLYTIGLKHHRPKAQQYCNCPMSRLKRASLIAQLVNYLPAMQDTRVWFLGQEDPLEKEMATHSGILAWRIPCTEEPDRLQSMGSQRVWHNWATSLSLSCIGEGNGKPLQCSCLENPRDGGAWWAAIYGVAQSRTWLKRLSSSSSSSNP